MITTTVAAVVGCAAAGMVLWRLRSPQTFERWITRSPRARFLIWWRYQRVWTRRMIACGLFVRRGDSVLIPRLGAVQIGRGVDRLQVRMCEQQTPWDFENRVAQIAHTFGAQECRARIIGPSTVGMVLRQSDSHDESLTLPRLETGWRDAA
ncbi:hypothetical protein [Nocardia jiangxiensis]|uniref:hypothetical protein n=1 Tax=Nocardia jiangxiensis TaxID=282685 RepID=UPI00030398BB|nr:hypothetical protein [Nocardia jiangxiensis]